VAALKNIAHAGLKDLNALNYVNVLNVIILTLLQDPIKNIKKITFLKIKINKLPLNHSNSNIKILVIPILITQLPWNHFKNSQ
jgi:hypothetical protein